MKKNAFCGILLILAAVIALGSVTVLGPCVHEDGSEALCTGREGCFLERMCTGGIGNIDSVHSQAFCPYRSVLSLTMFCGCRNDVSRNHFPALQDGYHALPRGHETGDDDSFCLCTDRFCGRNHC